MPAARYRLRRARQDFDEFSALVVTPGNLVTGVKLPANAVLYVSTTGVLASATALVTVAGGARGAPAGAANRRNNVGLGEAGSTVLKAGGAPGTVSLYVRNPAGKVVKIAQG